MRVVLFLLFTIFLPAVWHSSTAQPIGSATALEFDGTNHVSLSTDLTNIQLPFTFCFWMHTRNLNDLRSMLSTNADVTGYSGIWIQAKDDRILVNMGLGGGGFTSGNRATYRYLGAGFSGEWYFIAAVVRNDRDMELYVNGVLMNANYTGSTGSMHQPNGSAQIARNMTSTNWRYYDGYLDDLSIWDRALSQAEIRMVMSRKLTGNEQGLYAYYPMNGTGNTCTDASPNARNGTLVNNVQRVLSAAAIGDLSDYNYSNSGATLTNFTTTLATGQQIAIENITPPVEGVQVYEEQQAPNSTQGLPAGANISTYFGVYLCRTDFTQNHTYDLRIINPGSPVAVYGRNDNSVAQWQNKNAVQQGQDRVVNGDQNRQEYWIESPNQLDCDITEEYNVAGDWTFDNAGSEILIQNNQLQFVNATDGVNRRMYKALDAPLPECWTMQFEFEPISGGVNQVSGHLVLGLTEGNDCPLNTCSSVNTNFSNSAESGLLISIGTPRNSLPLNLRVRAKEGANNIVNSPEIRLNYGVKYYIQLERITETTGELSVFADPSYQQHIPGSPVPVTIPAGIGTLNYIQHATFPQGHPDRKLTANLDNVCIETVSCDCDELEVDLGPDIVRCKLDEETLMPLSVNSNYNYSWNTGAVGASLTVTQPGTYWIVADSAGCTGGDTIEVIETNTSPQNFIPQDTLLCEGESTYLEFDAPGYIFRWPSGKVAKGDTLTIEGLLKLEAYGPCDTTDLYLWVDIVDCDCKLFIPNAFTPNGDGRNDRYKLEPACPIENFDLRIFNRWGIEVFRTARIAGSWDGTVNGRPAPQGVYVFKLYYRTREREHNAQGHITLFR